MHIWETALSAIRVTNTFSLAVHLSFDLDYIFCHVVFMFTYYGF